MGYTTVAIARGTEREALARKLGASRFIDADASDPSAELTKLGGARVILATVPSATAMSAALAGLGPNGKMLVIGVSDEPLQASREPPKPTSA